jgi:hypothetical protein
MPIVYEDIVRGRQRSAFDLAPSTGEVLTETFAQAYEENPIAAAMRMLELSEAKRTGPKLSAQEARARLKEAGMESDLSVDDTGITEAALSTLMERKRFEKRRQETFALSDGGMGLGAARLGVAAVTTLADPISAALNFVPVVGEAKYARMLAGARGIAGRVAVRGGVGAAEGAVGAAIVEPLIYGMRTQEQADYDAVDSLLNVALGGLIGSGLHTTVGTVGEVFAKPAREVAAVPSNLGEKIDRLPAQEREQLLRTAVAQAVVGEPVNVSRLVDGAERRTVEGEISARLDAQEQAIREALTIPKAEAEQQLQQAVQMRDEARRVLDADEPSQIAQEAQRLAAEGAARPEAKAAEVVAAKRMEAQKQAAQAEARIDALQVAAEPDTALARIESMRAQRAQAGDARQMVDLLPEFERQPYLQRLDALETGASRNAPQLREDEYRAATESADGQLKVAPNEAPDSLPDVIGELATQAEADARLLAERLGIEVKDADLADVAEAAVKAERWARAAELATVCLVRGG